MNLGVQVDGLNVPILLYADDIVLLSETEDGLQKMLHKMHEWCTKSRMVLNVDKTKVLDFRNKRQTCTAQTFVFGNQEIQVTNQYKYFGVILDEFLDYKVSSNILADAAGRALGAIIGKTKQFKYLGFNTYSKLVDSGVVPVMNYGS